MTAFGFSDSTAPVGAPARAIVSAFQPTGDRADSNLYRQMEDVDTQSTAAQNPLLGIGFGDWLGAAKQAVGGSLVGELQILTLPTGALKARALGLSGTF